MEPSSKHIQKVKDILEKEHGKLFLIKDNKDTLPPKRLLKSRTPTRPLFLGFLLNPPTGRVGRFRAFPVIAS